jgi:general secretion pathway protein D
MRASTIVTKTAVTQLNVHRCIQVVSRMSVTLLLSCALNAGAAQTAYQDGLDLVSQDRIMDGLAKFREALEQEPRNAAYRSAYLQARERIVFTYLRQAEKLAAYGSHADAQKTYRSILSIDPSNERALAGVQTLLMHAMHEELIKNGAGSLVDNDITSARLRLSMALTENPYNDPALALPPKITDATIAAQADAHLSSAYRKPITIKFKKVSLKQIFDVISRTSGINFLLDKEIKTEQKTSIYLRNSTIESAVHFMLLTNQLEQQVFDANTILIYPNIPAKVTEYQK